MASRNFNRMQALEMELKQLQLVVSIGASGAPTVTRGKGVATVVRNSAGQYTITLQDKYNSLVGFSCTQLVATAQDTTPQLASETVNTTKTVVLRTLTAGTATDPSSGSKLFITLSLKNSAA